MSAYEELVERVNADQFKKVFHYDPVTGIFTRIVGRRVIDRNKSVAYVSPRKDGRRYVRLRVLGRFYEAGRLAWLYMTGEWPNGLIDHINCDSEDNRFSNLRVATLSQNSANSRLAINNSTGLKGVYKKASSFQAEITHNGKRFHLGTFKTKEEAHAAYVVAANEKFGEFARPRG